ncbi:MAG: hypothetical protein KKH94_11105 [Candidatus Omnitrophica bacterium]|nr:hypothetical protein [Candidatus Omnitrophota bacterium]
MLISAPTNFDYRLLRTLHSSVYDVYGNINRDGESIVPSLFLPLISLRHLKQYIAHAHACGVKFNYIMNHPHILPTNETQQFLDMLRNSAVDIVTISNPELIAFVKKYYPFQICSSIMSKINSINKVREYIKCGCDIICIDYHKNYDFDFIKEIKGLNVKVKLLVNNICLPDCPYEEGHWEKGVFYDKSTLHCLRLKLEQPALIEQSGFIRPNDIWRYEKIGVDYIKIGGRTKPTSWIVRCVRYYADRRHAKNYFYIMNTLGTENRYRLPLRTVVFLIPSWSIAILFRCLFYITRRKLFYVLSKEKNLKSLLRIILSSPPFTMTDHGVQIDKRKKTALLREIDKAIT